MSDNKNTGLDFAMILASAVHDMKNSLSILMNAITVLEKKYPAKDDDDRKQHSVLQYEASRLNAALVQLLGLYKLRSEQLPLNLNYHIVEDFLYDQAAQYEPLAKSKGIDIEIEVEDELEGCFDVDLIASVINNILGNAIRYTTNKITLSSFYQEGIIIEVIDDGMGYPANMLEQQENFIKSINYSTGSTGLGLYFAGQIARLHTSGEQHGSIELLNKDQGQGGIFRLWLPE
ncbi:MAG: HAMP domain-containing histidine kinase [Gammaproteobacteria bacterium]|nr:HAMP domain-containing histidine kinase [Gammaproteobacteria bacterium]NVK89066.1 HAMP domain-containing histidine kinase [Gammaproteobacteria bacterium]